ncbi:transposase [Brevibacillus brevis X23]|nr:transposase [Brevibacillus brevis X23]
MYHYRTINVPVRCSSHDLKYLYGLNKKSAYVWNLCLELATKYSEENDGKWISRNDLQKATKKCIDLHAKGIHYVAHKYLFARDGALQSKKKGILNVKYPWKKKKYFNTGWDSQSIKVDYAKGKIYLSKPDYIDTHDNLRRSKPVVCLSKSLPQNIVQVELKYDKRLYLSIKYKEKASYIQVKSKNTAAIDLGEIHSITSIDNSGNAIIITGRKMRSIKQHRNKQQAKIYKRMSKCKKGSSQRRKYIRAMSKLKVRYENKVNDCVHKISKLYLDYCLENQISTVYYGDLDGVTRSTRKNDKGNTFVRQKLSQWNYGELMNQLKNKLTRYGIKLVKVKEYYTSSKCPACKNINKPIKRNYDCTCGYKQHRDIVGAINILNDNHSTNLTHYTSKKYLQIA